MNDCCTDGEVLDQATMDQLRAEFHNVAYGSLYRIQDLSPYAMFCAGWTRARAHYEKV